MDLFTVERWLEDYYYHFACLLACSLARLLAGSLAQDRRVIFSMDFHQKKEFRSVFLEYAENFIVIQHLVYYRSILYPLPKVEFSDFPICFDFNRQ